MWFYKLSSALKDLGFVSTKSIPLFTQVTSTSSLYILIYVDDIVVISNSQHEIDELVLKLNASFVLKDMGPLHYFLGIEDIRLIGVSCCYPKLNMCRMS